MIPASTESAQAFRQTLFSLMLLDLPFKARLQVAVPPRRRRACKFRDRLYEFLTRLLLITHSRCTRCTAPFGPSCVSTHDDASSPHLSSPRRRRCQRGACGTRFADFSNAFSAVLSASSGRLHQERNCWAMKRRSQLCVHVACLSEENPPSP